MYWILSYCVLCWLVGSAILVWAYRRCNSEALQEIVGKNRVRWFLSKTLQVLWMPLFLPLAVAGTVYRIIQCVRGQMQLAKLAHTYREADFQPIDLSDLDADLAQSVDQATKALQDFGFESIGDFQTKSDPIPVYNRYLSGFGGAVFGDVTILFDECAPGLMSVLEDGTYVETSATEEYSIPGEIEPDDYLAIQMAGPRSLADLIEVHLSAVEQEAKKRGTRVLAFEREQFREVSVYGQRRFWSWRQRCGESTGEVPTPELPRGLALECSEIRGECCAR